ncbi:hypothetical protein SFRURICE_016734 [Spodoptera frugiperda]|nr:hypothetical protein SFRURICE_016734 [Spodoptera frugiperda]
MSPFSGRKKIQRAIHSGVVLVEQRATLARHPKAVLMNKNGSRYYAMKLIGTIKFLNYFSFGFIISSVWQYRKVEKTAEIDSKCLLIQHTLSTTICNQCLTRKKIPNQIWSISKRIQSWIIQG